MSYARRVMDSTPGLPPADALVAAREADARIASLESRLAASEGACAGLRAALEFYSNPENHERTIECAHEVMRSVVDVDDRGQIARQALQSEAGSKVAAVIAAAKRIPCKTLAAFLDYEQDAGRWRGENGSREAQNDIRALGDALATLNMEE